MSVLYYQCSNEKSQVLRRKGFREMKGSFISLNGKLVKMFVSPQRSFNSLNLFKVFIVISCILINLKLRSVHGSTLYHKNFRNIEEQVWNNSNANEENIQETFLAEKDSLKDIGFQSESSVLQNDIKTGSGCPATTSSHCLRCNSAGCIKCPMFLITDTRQCVQSCPSGYIDQWSAHTEFMGRVCIPTGYSGPLMAALAGLIGGFLVCLTLLGVAVMIVRRRRRRKAIKQKLINENTMDRSDFLRQLNDMRPNAEYYLAMLNDTRRQIRKLYLSGDLMAANSYRPIVRDLAKILILLNRPIELIPAVPHDWNRLYTWAEQALERYKPHVGQLIDFFQSPNNINFDNVDFDSPEGTKNHKNIFRQSAVYISTTSTSAASNSSGQKMHLFGSLISLHEFDEPRPSDPFSSNYNTLKSGNLISDLNASSLWLEDEFYKLGFRPQDEITTEL